jgi:hypothetical protein
MKFFVLITSLPWFHGLVLYTACPLTSSHFSITNQAIDEIWTTLSSAAERKAPTVTRKLPFRTMLEHLIRLQFLVYC